MLEILERNKNMPVMKEKVGPMKRETLQINKESKKDTKCCK